MSPQKTNSMKTKTDLLENNPVITTVVLPLGLIILSAILIFTTAAHAQRTGGSFGGSNWGAGRSSYGGFRPSYSSPYRTPKVQNWSPRWSSTSRNTPLM